MTPPGISSPDETTPPRLDWFDHVGMIVLVGKWLIIGLMVGLPIMLAILGPLIPNAGEDTSAVTRIFDIAMDIALGPLRIDDVADDLSVGLWLWGLYWFFLIAVVLGFTHLMRRLALALSSHGRESGDDGRRRDDD